MLQHTKEFHANGYFYNPDRSSVPGKGQIKHLDECINEYMEAWNKENTGHLNVAAIYTVDKQKIGGVETYAVVVFNQMPMSDLERQLQQLNA